MAVNGERVCIQGTVQKVIPQWSRSLRLRAPQPGLAAQGYNNVLLADPLPPTHPTTAPVQLKHVVLQ